MIDTDFPVWTIRPNWATAVVERLEWLTDIMQSSSGAVQTSAVRLSPRRSFEVAFTPVDQERTFMDLWIHRVGDQKLLTPLWHDHGRLSASAAKGAARIALDTRWREFEVGGLALLHNGDAFNTEVVLVEAIDPLWIDLVGTTGKPWRKGSSVYPLREAYMDMDLAMRALSANVGDATLLFKLDGANDLLTGFEPAPLFTGYPIVTLPPNRVDPLDMSFTRIMGEQDQIIGKVYRKDDADRAFTAQSYNWCVKGREQSHYLRQTLYRLQGRANAVWMPTFNTDVVLAQPALIGNNFLLVKQMGLKYLGGPASGRDHIMFRTPGTNAPLALKMSGMGVSHDDNVEKVMLDAALAVNLPAGRIASFVDTARCDNDSIEVHHHSDSDGLMEASAAFRTFKDTRDPSGSIYVPIPESVQFFGVCGEPSGPEADNPCAVPFAGNETVMAWYFEIPCNAGFTPSRNLTFPECQPNAPHGKVLNQLNNFDSLEIFENDYSVSHAGEPAYANCRGQKLMDVVCGNLTVNVTWYFTVPGGGYSLQVQYSAGFCGSVGLDHGTVAVAMCSVDEDHPLCVPTVFELGDIAGNFPYTYNWEF